MSFGPSFGLIRTKPGPFFGTDLVPAAEALRQPGRAFFGDGWQHNQYADGGVAGGSWLQAWARGTGTVTAWDYFEDLARVAVVSSFGIALTAAVRTSGSTTLDGIAFAQVVLNDSPLGRKAWGGYADAVKAHAAAGTTVGVEINATNLPGPSPLGGLTPYKALDGMVGGATIAAGSDALAMLGRSYAADFGLRFIQNGAAMRTGIVFAFDSVLREGMADDTSAVTNVAGYARDIAMQYHGGISWYSRDSAGLAGDGNQAEVVRLYSTVTDPAVRIYQVFGDQGITWQEGVPAAANLFKVGYRPDAGANIVVTPAAVGGSPSIGAEGTNANINLTLAPKGTGILYVPLGNVPVFADDAAAALGGVPVGGIYRTPTSFWKQRAA